ncbi:MAG: hypothetical protein Pars2KO_15670 [Parasphingorhabdus sp.]
MRSRRSYLFFVAMGVLYLLISIVGFGPSFLIPVLGGKSNFPFPVIVHSVIMFGWLALFITQAALAISGPSRLHKFLGIGSMFLFVFAMLSSVTLSIANFLEDLPEPIESYLDSIFFLQLWAFFLMPLFYWLGYRVRRNAPDEHMRYMLLLTFIFIEAAASRITFLPGMADDATFIYAQYAYLDLMLIPLFVYDLQQIGRLSRATIVGCSILFFYQFTAVITWDSESWSTFAVQLDTWLKHWWPL